jgi:hypothetical protein
LIISLAVSVKEQLRMLAALRHIVLVLFIGSVACSATASSPTTLKAPAARCRASQLRGSFGGFDAGAGQRYVTLKLWNSSRTSCALQGYPGVSLIGPGQQPIPSESVPTTTSPGTPLTIRPGRRVSSTLHWIGIPLSDEQQIGPCEPTPASAHVLAPGDSQYLLITWSFGPVCGHGQIDTSPLEPSRP